MQKTLVIRIWNKRFLAAEFLIVMYGFSLSCMYHITEFLQESIRFLTVY